MTDLDLDAIRARVNAATLGPWTDPTFISDPPDEAGWWILGGGVPGGIHEHAVAVMLPYNPHGRSDAEFVAHARTDVPALLAEVDRLDADNRRLSAALAEAESWIDNLTAERNDAMAALAAITGATL